MARTRTLIPVEKIDVSLEQENPDTWLRVLSYDGSGEYSPDGKYRLIVWRDADDNDEYPRQIDQWYPVGTLIPLST